MHSRSLPYLLLLPSLLLLCALFLYPFVLVAWQAIVDDGGQFTTEHFSEMLGHWKFDTAFKNTIYLTLAVVPIQIVLALYMASLVTGMKRGRDVFLYIWTIPLGRRYGPYPKRVLRSRGSVWRIPMATLYQSDAAVVKTELANRDDPSGYFSV